MKRLAPAPSEPGALAEPEFSATVIGWQQLHGRHALPWQNTNDAYRIWLSEIMLQQTQVAAVIPYYQRFLSSFPTIAALAAAPSEQVMAHWSGLGYYTRARNLHACAKRIVSEYAGQFPSDPILLAELPGIGRSTAAAIAAFAFGTRAAILDGNVKRVFCRVFAVDGFPGNKVIEDQLWRRAEALLPLQDLATYTQGLMDLGATLCTRTRPDCQRCPLAPRCVALATDRVALLPVRKPKKVVPQRYASMLLIVDQNQILLEQRPDSGIWGGLLSLPEIAATRSASDADEVAAGLFEQQLERTVAQFGVFAGYTRLTPFSHAFTHFKLHVSPCLVRLVRRHDQVGQGGHGWHRPESLRQAPLPAPVKQLLLEFFREADLFGNGSSA